MANIGEDKKNKELIKMDGAGNMKFTVMPQEFRKPAAKKFLSPKVLIIGGAVLAALVLSVVSVLIFMKPPEKIAEAPPPLSEVSAEIPSQVPISAAPEESPLLAPVATSTVPEAAAPEIPVIGELIAGADADADGLSDHEEVAFQTDPTRPDTDGDGFLDGNEVFNLYNPAAPPPVTLLESGIVRLYRNGSFGYTIYYPTTWSTSSTIDGRQASFIASAPDKDSINMLVMEAGEDMSLRSWYLSQYPEGNINSLQTYASKQGYDGLQDGERLNTYIKKGKKVFIISYDLGGKDTAWYRALYGMALNSLKIE